MVNCELPLKFRQSKMKETDYHTHQEKLYRDRYHNIQTQFFDFLKKLSIELKDYEVKDRKP